MKSKIAFIAIIAFITTGGYAQVCTGDFTFSNQTQINNFIIDNPFCTSIVGDVTIEDLTYVSTISSLVPLQNITSISGELKINSTELLTTLTGLENLESVGQLYILNCIGLTTLDHVSNLNQANEISIVHCPDIIHTDIFPNIESLNEGFVLTGYPMDTLGTFTGFENLITCGDMQFGNFQINLNAFHNLQQINGDLWFQFADFSGFSSFENLETVSGHMNFNLISLSTPDIFFPSLVTVGEELSIFEPGDASFNFESLVSLNRLKFAANTLNCPSLESISEFMRICGQPDYMPEFIYTPALITIYGDLVITTTQIQDLNFLSGLQFITGFVGISENPNLATCSIEAICDKISLDPENVNIYNNYVGCNSTSEVSAVCMGSYVSGLVYADLNCDSIFNSTDILINNCIIQNQNDLPVGSTHSDGMYLSGLPSNSITTLHAIEPLGFTAIQTHTFSSSDTDSIYFNYDFSLCPEPDLHNISVAIINTSEPSPGFSYELLITVSNLGASNEDITVTFDLENMNGVTVLSAPDGVIDSNSVTWSIDALGIFQNTTFSLHLLVDDLVELGSLLFPFATVQTSSGIVDDFPEDNNYGLTQVVVGSFDPNDKTVNRHSVNINQPNNGTGVELNYIIRFQNTGTAEAHFVRITDSITDNLDLSTFQMLNASHAFNLSFSENRVLDWLFENIQLPDSTTDEEGSHGYIHFKIRTIEEVTIDDVIENTAAIYFDYNTPVITNTATTVFYVCPSAVNITGDLQVCAGETEGYNASVGWDSYTWSLNEEVLSITNDAVLTDMLAGTYTLSLTATTQYCETTTELEVLINALPNIPTITQEINALTATIATTYQWYLNGNAIANATAQTFEITQTGNYSVMITDANGCTAMSDAMMISYIGVDEKTKNSISVYPNPIADISTVHVPENLLGKYFHVYTTSGELVLSGKLNGRSHPINCEDLAPGVYILRIENERVMLVKS